VTTVTGPAGRGGHPVPAADRGLFVHGVVPADTVVPPDLVGLDERPVHLVVADRVAAAVCWVDLDRPPGRRADLVSHQTVLDALSAVGPVAPVRFGSVLEDADTVREGFLRPQEDVFVEILHELRGRHQFNLRATYVEEVVLGELVATDPEIRMLRQRTREVPEEASYRDRVRLGELVARSLEARSAEDADLLLAAALPHSVAHVVRTPPSATQVVDVALLVDDDAAAALEQHLEELAEAVHERIRLRLLGPVAPYDFAGTA
jgi:hypothetical protein